MAGDPEWTSTVAKYGGISLRSGARRKGSRTFVLKARWTYSWGSGCGRGIPYSAPWNSRICGKAQFPKRRQPSDHKNVRKVPRWGLRGSPVVERGFQQESVTLTAAASGFILVGGQCDHGGVSTIRYAPCSFGTIQSSKTDLFCRMHQGSMASSLPAARLLPAAAINI